MSSRSMVCRRSISSQRTPEAPRPNDSILSTITRRTTALGKAVPTPQQCDRIRLRCSCEVWSAGMRVVASLPKPVLIP